MKVAIVYHYFANYRQPILEYLDRETDDDYLFIADSSNRVMPGVPVWTPPAHTNFMNSRCFLLPLGFLIQRNVIGLAFRKDIDAIIYLGDWKFITTWISSFLARTRGKRILFWTHGWLVPERGVPGWIRRIFYRLAQGLLLYGNTARQIGIDKGFSPDRLYVVFNSLDYRAQQRIRHSVTKLELVNLRKQMFTNPGLPTIFLVGRLSPGKRVGLLIEAAALLQHQKKSVNILIVGNGEEKEKLVRLAGTLGVDAHFHGACHDENEVGRLLMSSDLTVCPAAAGLTVIHSLAYGVPVVTSNDRSVQGPEVDAIIPDVSGAFFEDGDAESLAATIARLVFDHPPLSASNCYAVIEKYYNVEYQAKVLYRALRLLPAENDKFDLNTVRTV